MRLTFRLRMIAAMVDLIWKGFLVRGRLLAGSREREAVDRSIAAQSRVLFALVVGDDPRYRAAVLALNAALPEFLRISGYR